MVIRKGSLIEDGDSELWECFRAGDQSSYNILVDKYFKPLFDYGIRFSQDRAFLKDCIQEVFLELWHKRSKINSTPSVKYYLFKSVRLKIFREQSKWNREELLNEKYDFTVEFNIESLIIERTTLSEQSGKILSILNELPPRQREIIYLRFYEALDYSAISEIMNLSRQSVHNLLQKAYTNFRTEWTTVLMFVAYFSALKSISYKIDQF